MLGPTDYLTARTILNYSLPYHINIDIIINLEFQPRNILLHSLL